MMTMQRLDFDFIKFKTISEGWNLYELEDKSVIKAKVLVISVVSYKKKPEDKRIPDLGVNLEVVTGVESYPGVRGEPSEETYTIEQLNSFVEKGKADMKITSIRDEWNGYELPDGTKLYLKNAITRVGRTSKFDKIGNPMYVMQNSILQKSIPKGFS